MIQWNPALETGHQMVDSDHQKLISTLNELDEALKNGTGKEELSRIVTFLVVYTKAHFAREEQHMRAVNCPSMVQNCAAHGVLKKKLDGWVETMKTSGPTTPLLLEVYRETSAWITAHILRVDCQLRNCRAA
jgi:hemerythrin